MSQAVDHPLGLDGLQQHRNCVGEGRTSDQILQFGFNLGLDLSLKVPKTVLTGPLDQLFNKLRVIELSPLLIAEQMHVKDLTSTLARAIDNSNNPLV